MKPLVHKGAKLVYARTEVEVLHVSNGSACVISKDGEMDLVHDLHLLTSLDHNEKINDILDVLAKSYEEVTDTTKPREHFEHYAEDLIKAGYRKLPSLNREFTAGDTYKGDSVDVFWVSGINIPGHGNAIECYAGTEEGAELLRDEILERIKR